jgi:hypothetical protein
MDEVKKQIAEADLVIVDFTGKNPNVHYEADLAEAWKKDWIVLAQSSDDMTFDVRHIGSIRYANTMGADIKLREDLKQAIEGLGYRDQAKNRAPFVGTTGTQPARTSPAAPADILLPGVAGTKLKRTGRRPRNRGRPTASEVTTRRIGPSRKWRAPRVKGVTHGRNVSAAVGEVPDMGGHVRKSQEEKRWLEAKRTGSDDWRHGARNPRTVRGQRNRAGAADARCRCVGARDLLRQGAPRHQARGKMDAGACRGGDAEERGM